MKIVQITEVAKPINNSVKSFDGERLYVATKTLKSNTIELKYSEKVDFKNKPSRANQEVDNGDVVFAKMQGTRKTLLITDIEKDYIFSSGFFVLRKNESILPEYLFHFLNSSFFLEQKDRNCTGATQKALTLEGLKKVYIPLPSIQTQKKIVTKLDKLTTLIELRKESIAKTEQLTKSIFIEMFGDPMLNEKGWEIKTLVSLCNKITDGKHGDCNNDEKSGYYFISAKDLVNGRIQYTNSREILEKDFREVHRRTNLQLDDVLIVSTGASIGKTAIVLGETKKYKNTTFQKSVAILSTNKEELIGIYLKSYFDFTIKNILNISSGSGQKNLLLQEIRAIKIPVPPISLQNKFAEIVKVNEENIRKQKKSLESLEELYASCMQESFRF